MEESEAIRTEAGYVLVVNEVLAFEVQLVIFTPIASNGQYIVGPLDDCNYVRQRDAGRLAVVVQVFKALEVQVNVALQQDVAVVVQITEAGLFVLGLLNVGLLSCGVAQLDVTVKARLLELDDVVFGLAHDVCQAVASVHVRGAVRQENVFCGHKHRHLTPQIGVVVHLLERRACGWQRPQHALVLWPELFHHVRQLVVHVGLNAPRSLLLLGSLFANDLRAHRPLGGERLRDCF